MKYTLESLKEINSRFCSTHYLRNSDVNKANRYVELIENSRSEIEPRIGDIVQYINEYGDYYMSAHIDNIYDDEEVNICEQPYIPFINANVNNDGICCSTSGGAWCNIPKDKLVYIGEREKKFCDWGNCGACADGAIEFKAKVSVWSYTSSENKFISKINGKPYTTKDFKKMHIYYNPNENSRYNFFGNSHAWVTDLEMQAWLRTFRAEVFDFGYNHMVVWYWKEERHSISPKEFESLDLPEDTLMNNAKVLRCKRKYDEETHTVHTYWVWYWDESGKDWREAAIEQNKIRDELYTLDWHTPVNLYATKEIMSGRIKPISLNVVKYRHDIRRKGSN